MMDQANKLNDILDDPQRAEKEWAGQVVSLRSRNSDTSQLETT